MMSHRQPTAASFTAFTRLPDRKPGEQQHIYSFTPRRLPEAPAEETLVAPARRAAEGDDDLMSQDINASASSIDPAAP